MTGFKENHSKSQYTPQRKEETFPQSSKVIKPKSYSSQIIDYNNHLWTYNQIKQSKSAYKQLLKSIQYYPDA